MGNLGGGEILIILLAALLFLGPQKLPDAARQIGKAMAELRKITSGFQRELRDAINDDSVVESDARARGDALVASERAQSTASPAAIEASAVDAGDATAPAAVVAAAEATDAAPVVERVAPAAAEAAALPPSGDR